MFKKNMTFHEVADVIQRYLEHKPSYFMEWNDFIDTSQVDGTVNAYRRRCYELDPLINHPGDPDPAAISELDLMIKELRNRPVFQPSPRLGPGYWGKQHGFSLQRILDWIYRRPR